MCHFFICSESIFVVVAGRRCRAHELMFPSKPRHFAFSRPHLCLFSEHQIIVFNVQTSEWIQTINLRKAMPLNLDGTLVLCYVLDMPYLVMLGNNGTFCWIFVDFNHKIVRLLVIGDERLIVPATSQLLQSKNAQKRRRKFSMRTSKDDLR